MLQACNATDYARWVRALCVEILGQTPLPHVRFLDVLPAADMASKQSLKGGETPPGPPRAPPRARRRLLTVSSETQLPIRDHSPAATDEGIVVEDDDYDSSSDRSLDLSLDASKGADVVDSPLVKCDNCSKLNASPAQHHTLPRAARSGQAEHTRHHRYLKRWEGVGAGTGGAERGRLAIEAARRKTCSLESRARSCSPAASNDAAVNFVPVRERRALFESLVTYGVGSAGGLGAARSSEALVAASVRGSSPRRASSMHDLATPPSRSVSDLRQYFEAVARASCGATLQRHSAPASTHHHPPLRPYASLTCA